MKKKSKYITASLIIICSIIIYFIFDPSHYLWFPRCPFLIISGYKCPGCGSQRTIHALLHFNIQEAFHYNAFLVCSIPFIIILTIAEILRKSKPKFYIRVHRPLYIYIYLIAVILWWILRNIYGY